MRPMEGRPKKRPRKGKDGRDSSKASSSSSKNQKPFSSLSSALIDVPISDLTTQQRYDLIAELSESVLEDPDAAFASTRVADADRAGKLDGGVGEQIGALAHRVPSKVRRLLDMANPTINGGDENTARLAMLSLLAVFRDVLPSYRIRLPTEAERTVRVTKDVKKLWDYERNLLTHYQSYLKLLERTWSSGSGSGEGNNNTAAVGALAVTAIMCLCELLKSAPHFNFRSNILTVVVKQMNNRNCEEVSAACCGAVNKIFSTDVQGEIALEASRLVAKMVKDRNFSVRPEVLRTLLALPLRVHEDEAQAAKLAAEAKKKRRRKDRETAEIEDEMKEGDATVDKIVLARSQADTLHAVMLIYFRILKAENLSDSRIAELLPPALEGLAKFAHLVNMDTVVDLLAVLKKMLKRVDSLPLDAGLNCVLTAFQTLQGPGQEMQIDQKEYVTPLYGLLPRLCSEGDSVRHTELALKCLYVAFLKRREHSNVRAAAFVKQLCTVSMHAPPPTSAPLLAFARQLVQRYPGVQQMLENEQDIITSGAYTPTAEDPEHTNPFACSAWELATLKFHIHPLVSEHAVGAAALHILQLPAKDPARIRSDMIEISREGYIACRVSKKKHPLRAGRADKDKRKRQQIRFVTPRETANHHLK